MAKYSKKEIAQIFSRFQKSNPEPRTELIYTNTFTLLLAVVLSAQATDKGVNKATKNLFERVDKPEDIVEMGEEELCGFIKSIGLYRSKARNIVKLSEQLIVEHGGQVPEDQAALEKLPGVGRKTANVVMNEAFGVPTIAVDTHIFRLGNRLGIAPGKTPLEVEHKLLKTVPVEFLRFAHHWLILHGRYICKARKPECERCMIADLCKSKEKIFS